MKLLSIFILYICSSHHPAICDCFHWVAKSSEGVLYRCFQNKHIQRLSGVTNCNPWAPKYLCACDLGVHADSYTLWGQKSLCSRAVLKTKKQWYKNMCWGQQGKDGSAGKAVYRYPRTHKVEGENSGKLPSDFTIHCGLHVHTRVYTNIYKGKCKNIKRTTTKTPLQSLPWGRPWQPLSVSHRLRPWWSIRKEGGTSIGSIASLPPVCPKVSHSITCPLPCSSASSAHK